MRRSKKSRVIHENLNKSKSLIKLLLFILIVMFLGVGFLILRSTTILFNNVNKSEEEKIIASINEYFEKICDKENPSLESKCFSSNKIYLIENIIGNDDLEKQYKAYDNYYYAYSWVLEENYVKKDDKVIDESGSSIPNKILLGKKGEKYTVLKNEIPGDGTNYPKDMKKLFPAKIRNKLNNAQIDGTVTELQEENIKKAEEYFK